MELYTITKQPQLIVPSYISIHLERNPSFFFFHHSHIIFIMFLPFSSPIPPHQSPNLYLFCRPSFSSVSFLFGVSIARSQLPDLYQSFAYSPLPLDLKQKQIPNREKQTRIKIFVLAADETIYTVQVANQKKIGEVMELVKEQDEKRKEDVWVMNGMVMNSNISLQQMGVKEGMFVLAVQSKGCIILEIVVSGVLTEVNVAFLKDCSQIMDFVEAKIGIPHEMQNLFFNGTRVLPGKSLMQLGAMDGCKFYLSLRCGMLIHFETVLNDRLLSFPLDVDSTDSLLNIRALIAYKWNAPQMLLYKAQFLEDSKHLAFYSISNEAIINMVPNTLQCLRIQVVGSMIAFDVIYGENKFSVNQPLIESVRSVVTKVETEFDKLKNDPKYFDTLIFDAKYDLYYNEMLLDKNDDTVMHQMQSHTKLYYVPKISEFFFVILRGINGISYTLMCPDHETVSFLDLAIKKFETSLDGLVLYFFFQDCKLEMSKLLKFYHLKPGSIIYFANSSKFALTVCFLDSEQQFTLLYEDSIENETIGSIKMKLEKKSFIAASRMAIFFDGRQLLDSANLGSCGVEVGSTLFMKHTKL